MSERPIGIFDSGVGGLSILKAIQDHLPNENLLYFADSKYAPYGQLDEDILKQRCLFIADFFIKQNAKAMVIACNTATALMAEWLRAEYDIPIIAIEPAIKPAAQLSSRKKIGVFATTHTLNSQRYKDLKLRFAQDLEIFESDCQGFVTQVEHGELDSLKTITLIETNLLPMLDQGIDTLVLGCTHYPFLTPTIQQVAGDYPLQIIDNAEAVSQHLATVLFNLDVINYNNDNLVKFYTSCNKLRTSMVFQQLLNREASVDLV